MKIKKQHGLTLPEVMITMIIGLFVIGAILSVFVMSSSSVRSTGQMGELTRNGRLALSILEQDIAQVGFFSDLTGKALKKDFNITLPCESKTADGVCIELDLSGDCYGGGNNNGSFPNGFGHFRLLWAATKSHDQILTCESSPLFGSDIIQIKRLVAPELESSDTKGTNNFYFAINPLEGVFFKDGDNMLPNLPGQRIYEYQHYAYYIKNNTSGIPSLYRHDLSTSDFLKSPIALVEGIELMQFEFGIDSNGDSRVDAYLASDNVIDSIWDHQGKSSILAIRLHLIIRSLYKDNQYDNSNLTFTMPNGDFTPSADGYRRKKISTIIMLNNPMLISLKE